jgi:pimeloyl-ACP methyl ester carboxylesterase
MSHKHLFRRFFAICLVHLMFTSVHAAPTTRPATQPAFGVRVVGHGRPMILIPGLACSGEVWDDTVEHFKDRCECHVLTLAGFAGQPPVDGPWMQTMHSRIVAYIREKKLDHPVIVGHSIGGYLTYLLGAYDSDVVGPLISVDGLPCLSAAFNPSVTREQLAESAQMIRQSAQNMTREQFDASQKRTLSMWLTKPQHLERALKWGAASDPKTTFAAMADMIEKDLRPDVGKIRAPFLLIGAPTPMGAFTREKIIEAYSAQVEKIPNKKFAFAENSRHFIMYDQPQWLWQQMEEFLKDHP